MIYSREYFLLEDMSFLKTVCVCICIYVCNIWHLWVYRVTLLPWVTSGNMCPELNHLWVLIFCANRSTDRGNGLVCVTEYLVFLMVIFICMYNTTSEKCSKRSRKHSISFSWKRKRINELRFSLWPALHWTCFWVLSLTVTWTTLFRVSAIRNKAITKEKRLWIDRNVSSL